MAAILFVDDDAEMRGMVADVLRSAGHEAHLAATGTEAFAAIRERRPELVVLDYRMGPPDGLEICRAIKTNPRTEHLPVLMLTAESATEGRLAGFEAGADDYLPKPFDARELLARVGALLRLARQGLDRNPTSTLPGGEAIEREFTRRRRAERPFAICYFDLDHFKPFGDRFGFPFGDRVIREAGTSILEGAAPDDFAGHVGGDDFLLMCDPERARETAEGVQRSFWERLEGLLPADVRREGSYLGTDRQGVERRIPLPRLTAAILYVDPQVAGSLAEMGETIARVKQRAKAQETGLAEMEITPDQAEGSDGGSPAPDRPSNSRNS